MFTALGVAAQKRFRGCLGMAQNLLAALALAGVVERSNKARTLRVSPRFMAHAEGTAGRLRLLGLHLQEKDVLHSALSTWDEFHQDAWPAAGFLAQIMTDRDQMGALRPVFPALEAFAAA
jgi:hypothetical protein